ncbi:phosphorylase family protein [Cellvibrio japonicus]|uniref:Putative methylthioadenosine/S-adenosyl homocysteine nucleosidase n=1 Tax=Cellvibrio japonicus (strain Ueda107) TaxID=498211 RepID=B3PIQ8_CELJU|nr:methylthioadenosine/S-adenosyl homocysteine nucleosidase [Cellvibrio japonicus]ACE85472.1 putative methylthioadenosine/S-adenosyl homocysteine nucleosidase [Cellvibrio japonicus Ueda107]QEI13972.1 hypothetical protein FY117_18265 [Cellvibrio japonicus]QEI17546.1 hypothetical protein FY116_18270 [Cellvibrio japonicus]QEI21122.1 hypothetical protein FY115_18265 [Cellvibrio japonicus]
MNNKLKHLCIIFAMRDEAMPTIQRLKLIRATPLWDNNLPLILYRGKYNNLSISCIIIGVDAAYNVDLIGPVPATLAATMACAHLVPDLLISCGTAGLLSDDSTEIGKTYISNEHCFFHDRRVPLPGFNESALGGYPVIDTTALAVAIGATQGIVSSGSSLALTISDLDAMRECNSIVKDMECAAIAWICFLTHTPFFAIKTITNVLLSQVTSEHQFVNNFDMAVSNLSDSIIKSIDLISNSEFILDSFSSLERKCNENQ